MPSPHVDDEKGKKVMIYKASKDRRRGGPKKEGERKRKIRSLGYVRSGFITTYYPRILDLFYTKIQYFGLGSN